MVASRGIPYGSNGTSKLPPTRTFAIDVDEREVLKCIEADMCCGSSIKPNIAKRTRPGLLSTNYVCAKIGRLYGEYPLAGKFGRCRCDLSVTASVKVTELLGG